MTHVFVLVILIGGNVSSQDMHFWDIERCNYFAASVSKRYGNHKSYVPAEHMVISYCKPVLVDPNKVLVYN